MSDVTDVPEGWQAVSSSNPFEREIFSGPGASEGTLTYNYFHRQENGRLVLGFRPNARHANDQGIIHGGALMTFLDASLGATVWHAVDKRRIVTMSLTTEFLSPARPGDLLVCRPEITRKARSVVFARAEVKIDDRLVLTANSLWKIVGA